MPSLATIPTELQLRIYGYAALNLDYAVSATPPLVPCSACPFSFAIEKFPDLHNKTIYINARSAFLSHILNSTPVIRIYNKDFNFDNATLLLQTLNSRGKLAQFTNIENAGYVTNAPRQLNFFHITTAKFPKGCAKLKAFSKFVEALMPAPGSHLRASHSVMMCDKIKILEDCSLKHRFAYGKFGAQFDSALVAIQVELTDHVRRLQEEMRGEGEEIERSVREAVEIKEEEGEDEDVEMDEEAYESDEEEEDPLERALADRDLD